MYVHFSLATNGILPSRFDSGGLLTQKTTCAKLIAGGHGVLKSWSSSCVHTCMRVCMMCVCVYAFETRSCSVALACLELTNPPPPPHVDQASLKFGGNSSVFASQILVYQAWTTTPSLKPISNTGEQPLKAFTQDADRMGRIPSNMKPKST